MLNLKNLNYFYGTNISEINMNGRNEKYFRTVMVRLGLFTFYTMGFGKYIYEIYFKIKDEEKKLGRKLSDNETHQIAIDVANKYRII